MPSAGVDHDDRVSGLFGGFQAVWPFTDGRAIVIGGAASGLEADARATVDIGRNEDDPVVLQRLLNLVQGARMHPASPGLKALDR